MKANVGDVISWELGELEYIAEVVGMSEHEYYVYVVYEEQGLSMDKIRDDQVLRVWKQA